MISDWLFQSSCSACSLIWHSPASCCPNLWLIRDWVLQRVHVHRQLHLGFLHLRTFFLPRALEALDCVQLHDACQILHRDSQWETLSHFLSSQFVDPQHSRRRLPCPAWLLFRDSPLPPNYTVKVISSCLLLLLSSSFLPSSIFHFLILQTLPLYFFLPFVSFHQTPANTRPTMQSIHLKHCYETG